MCTACLTSESHNYNRNVRSLTRDVQCEAELLYWIFSSLSWAIDIDNREAVRLWICKPVGNQNFNFNILRSVLCRVIVFLREGLFIGGSTAVTCNRAGPCSHMLSHVAAELVIDKGTRETLGACAHQLPQPPPYPQNWQPVRMGSQVNTLESLRLTQTWHPLLFLVTFLFSQLLLELHALQSISPWIHSGVYLH